MRTTVSIDDLFRCIRKGDDSRESLSELWYLFNTVGLYVKNEETLREITKITKALSIVLNNFNVRKDYRNMTVNITGVISQLSRISLVDVQNKVDRIIETIKELK